MAEGILRYKWNKMNRTGLSVSSMGIHGLDHKPAVIHAFDVCKENDIDISSHYSRELIIPELDEAHLIFCMELIHIDFVRLFIPKLSEKVFLLGAWPNSEKRKSNISDPIGRPIKEFRRVFSVISNHIDRIIPILIEEYFYI
jgi:protein-tyrosine phosphatase